MLRPVAITSAERFLPFDKIWEAPAWAGTALFVTCTGPIAVYDSGKNFLPWLGTVGFCAGATALSAITWAPVELYELITGSTPYFYDSKIYDREKK